eukprot:TRINITY_DN7262_c0_g1_i1.p1 TRINITY_DN7262_c0_g1~~TRINITY_DN7262_c0_g1_i1.p1  ORF type:complete len:1217 (-),score=447.96 TRINITY_DN7262_c0_g1_i1:241-3612(-)
MNISGPTNLRKVDGHTSVSLSREDLPYSDMVTFDMETGEEVQMASVDEDVKRRWIEHIVLGSDNVSDPPGIKVRPVKGLKGCAYLDPRLKKFSYVWGPFMETLQGAGYDDTNMKAATYDWRLPPGALEVRDGLYSEMRDMIEQLYNDNDKRKVVLMGHSLGTRCLGYFLRWAEKHCGREWTSKYVHTYIAIGPLFLGAPKSIRATISGERMGLDAFLYPEEGVRMTRNVGSSPWMYPSKLQSYGLRSFTFIRNERGDHVSATLEEAMAQGECSGCYRLYQEHYKEDDCVGDEEADAAPPPVDRMYAIYGINLRTECVYFFKESKSKEPVTKLVLDPDGFIQHYKCVNGIGYETKRTPQQDGRFCSGDGTVPYASLSHCRKWQALDDIDVRITELEKCEHRDILKDKRFVKHMIEYVCYPPPPILLPEGFRNTKFTVKSCTKGQRKTTYKFFLTRKGLEIYTRKNDLKVSVRYPDIESVEESSSDPLRFTMKLEGQSSNKSYTCELITQLLTDLRARQRYVRCMLATASKTGESEEVRDKQGQTELHRAVNDNNIDGVRSLLSKSTPADVNALDNHGWSPLHIAACAANLPMVEELLKAEDIEVNMVSQDGTTPLHYLARVSHQQNERMDQEEFERRLVAVLDAMLARGLNLNIQKNNGETALHQAIGRRRMETAHWLVDHGANVNSRTENLESPLHYAIMAQSIPLIEYLLAHGADKHARNKDQKTPLALAKEMSKELFAAVCGVDPSTIRESSESTDEYGQTALHKAAFEGRTDAVFALINDGADPNIMDKNGWTPLHGAANNGHLDCILLLLGAPNLDVVNTSGGNQTSALHLLVRLSRDGVDKQKAEQSWNMFVDRGGDVNALNRSKETPLHQAVIRNNLHAVAWLLDNGAEVDAESKRGDTPMHYAVRTGSRAMVSLLLEYEPNIELKGCEGTVMDLVEKVDPTMKDLFEDDGTDSSFGTPRDYRDSHRSPIVTTMPDLQVSTAVQTEDFSHKLGIRSTLRRKKSPRSPRRDGSISAQRLSKEVKKMVDSKRTVEGQEFKGTSVDGSVVATVTASSATLSLSAAAEARPSLGAARAATVSLSSANEALADAFKKQAQAKIESQESLTNELDILKDLLVE